MKIIKNKKSVILLGSLMGGVLCVNAGKVAIDQSDSPNPYDPNGGYCDYNHVQTWRTDGAVTITVVGTDGESAGFDDVTENCVDETNSESVAVEVKYTEKLTASIGSSIGTNQLSPIQAKISSEIGAEEGREITYSKTVNVTLPPQEKRRVEGWQKIKTDIEAEMDHFYSSDWEVEGDNLWFDCPHSAGEVHSFGEGSDTSTATGDKGSTSGRYKISDAGDCPTPPPPPPGD